MIRVRQGVKINRIWIRFMPSLIPSVKFLCTEYAVWIPGKWGQRNRNAGLPILFFILITPPNSTGTEFGKFLN